MNGYSRNVVITGNMVISKIAGRRIIRFTRRGEKWCLPGFLGGKWVLLCNWLFHVAGGVCAPRPDAQRVAPERRKLDPWQASPVTRSPMMWVQQTRRTLSLVGAVGVSQTRASTTQVVAQSRASPLLTPTAPSSCAPLLNCGGLTSMTPTTGQTRMRLATPTGTAHSRRWFVNAKGHRTHRAHATQGRAWSASGDGKVVVLHSVCNRRWHMLCAFGSWARRCRQGLRSEVNRFG